MTTNPDQSEFNRLYEAYVERFQEPPSLLLMSGTEEEKLAAIRQALDEGKPLDYQPMFDWLSEEKTAEPKKV